MQNSMDSKNIAIVYVRESTWRIYFLDMNKREAKKLMINSNLIDKIGILCMVMNEKYYDDNDNDNDNENDNDNGNDNDNDNDNDNKK